LSSQSFTAPESKTSERPFGAIVDTIREGGVDPSRMGRHNRYWTSALAEARKKAFGRE
jgi:hypothetical protein